MAQGNPVAPLNLAPTRNPLVATSNDLDAGNQAGIVTVRDSVGTPRSVRVVQKEEAESANMVRVSWFYTFEEKSYTIELRHGRRSGIRKIYVNKELVERDKKWSYALTAKASVHDFDVGPKQARISVEPMGGSNYHYQLFIDGRIVEAAPPAASELRSRVLRIEKNKRIGMTLQNNSMGPGVVVVQFQPESAARDAGVKEGDIILAVNSEPVNTHEIAVYKIDQVREGDAFLMSVAVEGISELYSAREAAGQPESARRENLIYT
mmetsp:Transcript_29745/g.79945  ORF Transcript_29745/g.79945 Transcript_29745/m.79945 type:complete len:264 (-) Transcript_29745:346-1137(-)